MTKANCPTPTEETATLANQPAALPPAPPTHGACVTLALDVVPGACLDLVGATAERSHSDGSKC